MSFFSFKKNSGFTLVELLVAMAIFGLLSALVIANFSKGTETNKFKQASLEFAQNIRLAQNYAISGKSLWRCAGNKALACTTDTQVAVCASAVPCENKVPAGGFGVDITSGVYNIFTDQSESGGPSRTFDPIADGSAIIVEYMLSMSSNIASIKYYKLSDQSEKLSMDGVTIDITFEPPTGIIHFCINQNNCSALDSETTIDFLIANNNDPGHNCRQVTINKISGQISEQGNPNCSL